MSIWYRLGTFLKFVIFSFFTLGLYAVYFWISRQEDTNALLEEIRDELRLMNTRNV